MVSEGEPTAVGGPGDSPPQRQFRDGVKRSGSELLSELSNVFQLLRSLVDFYVGRFVGRFVTRVSMDEAFVSDSLSEW